MPEHRCPKCDALFRLTEAQLGSPVRCGRCEATFVPPYEPIWIEEGPEEATPEPPGSAAGIPVVYAAGPVERDRPIPVARPGRPVPIVARPVRELPEDSTGKAPRRNIAMVVLVLGFLTVLTVASLSLIGYAILSGFQALADKTTPTTATVPLEPLPASLEQQGELPADGGAGAGGDWERIGANPFKRSTFP